MPCESSLLKSMLASAMVVALKIIHISSEHYTTGIIPNLYISLWHISHFSRAMILNCYTSQSRKVIVYSARWPRVIGSGIYRINFLLEQQLCQSFEHPTRLTWPMFQAISMPGHCISQLVICEMRFPARLKSVTGFSFGLSDVPQ